MASTAPMFASARVVDTLPEALGAV